MFSICKLRLEELSKIFLECQPDCEDCDNFIFQLSEHIRATHVIHEYETSNYNEFGERVSVTNTRLRVKKSTNYQKYSSNPPRVQSQPVKTKSRVNVEILPSVTSATATDRNGTNTTCNPYSVYDNDYLSQDSEIEQCVTNDDIDMEFKYEVDPVNAESEEQQTDSKIVENPVVVQEGTLTPIKPKRIIIRIRHPKHHAKLKQGMTQRSKGPHICSVCKVEFEKGIVLINHFNEEHSDAIVKPYGCPLCDRTFEAFHKLGQHKRTVHFKKNNFVCEICEKAYDWKSHLDVHMRSHTGEKPYLCFLCGKCFARKDAYNLHMTGHLEVRPFKCDHCSQSFVKRGKLIIHLRTHTGEKPYMCDLCGKSYAVQELLTVHKRSHTGEKPFICEQCSKCFTTRRSLNSHIMKAHGEVKEFSCEHCGKDFPLKSQLRVHCKTHQ